MLIGARQKTGIKGELSDEKEEAPYGPSTGWVASLGVGDKTIEGRRE